MSSASRQPSARLKPTALQLDSNIAFLFRQESPILGVLLQPGNSAADPQQTGLTPYQLQLLFHFPLRRWPVAGTTVSWSPPVGPFGPSAATQTVNSAQALAKICQGRKVLHFPVHIRQHAAQIIPWFWPSTGPCGLSVEELKGSLASSHRRTKTKRSSHIRSLKAPLVFAGLLAAWITQLSSTHKAEPSASGRTCEGSWV